MEHFMTMIFRTLFLYFFILVVLRMMGKREIAKLSVIDLVITIMIAEISVIAIEDTTKPLLYELVPIGILMTLQVIIAWISLKSRKMRRILEGTPTVLIEKGKINDREMARLRYNMDDLLQQLREKNISNVADVEFAILETSGKLSVFPKEPRTPVTKEDLRLNVSRPSRFPTPLIIDGKVLDEHLEKMGKTRFWLKNQVQKHNVNDFKKVAFCSIDGEGNIFVDLKDD